MLDFLFASKNLSLRTVKTLETGRLQLTVQGVRGSGTVSSHGASISLSSPWLEPEKSSASWGESGQQRAPPRGVGMGLGKGAPALTSTARAILRSTSTAVSVSDLVGEYGERKGACGIE